MLSLPDALKIAVRRLRGVASSSERLSDRQLLQRFTLNRDESAFAALLERHGSMVLGVCRRVLGCPQTADDAFQGTFLVLLRKAGSLAWRESVGSWLHQVAYRVALKARVSQQRRRARERLAASMNPEPQAVDNDRRELLLALDAELAILPEKYRQPIVLCYLQGRSHEEAAAELGWPVGTVKGRLSRGREELRKRLVRRGITPGAALLTSVGGLGVGAAEVSAALARATQELARVFFTGRVSGCASASVLTLAQGMVRTMALRKLRHALISVVALVVIGGGVGLLGRSMWAVHGREAGDGSKASLSDNASGAEKDSKASADPQARLRENLKARREMLLKAFHGRLRQWRAGKITLDPLKDDLRALVKVGAELYSDKKERVAGLEECVKLTRELVKVTGAKAADRLATEADGLEVKVLLLEIQAELLREQNKTAPTVDKDRLTWENSRKIKPRTTTYKEVVGLLGEPAAKNTTRDGKVRSAKWISGAKSITVIFEDGVVRSKMMHAIPVPENPKLTRENLDKIKPGTTTFKEVVELFGEPTARGTTKEGKIRSAAWISGIKSISINFKDDVVRSINAAGMKRLRGQNKPRHARDLNRLTRENYDKIKLGATTYKEVVELLGEPDGTNRPLARGEALQAVWVVGSRRINAVFVNDVVKLKKASGIPDVAP
jgi:RNA polymerase sigma factor (sigma-70 family)